MTSKQINDVVLDGLIDFGSKSGYFAKAESDAILSALIELRGRRLQDETEALHPSLRGLSRQQQTTLIEHLWEAFAGCERCAVRLRNLRINSPEEPTGIQKEAATSTPVWKHMHDQAPADGTWIWWDYGKGPMLQQARDFASEDGGIWTEVIPPIRSEEHATKRVSTGNPP